MHRLASPLGRAMGKSSAPDEYLLHLARRAWREQGVAVIRLDDVHNDWERQAVENVANRLHGRRQEGG